MRGRNRERVREVVEAPVGGFVAGQLATTPTVTVQDLFLAGLLPGFLMVGLLVLHAMWVGRGLPKAATGVDRKEVAAALWDAKWELPLPLVVLGGIYGGQFAASEAAAITTLYVLIVTVGIKREIKFGQLPQLMAEAMRLVGAILIILGAAGALSNWLVDQEVPNKLFEFSRAYVHSGGMFLMLLNVVLLMVGMFIDIFSAIVILTPLLVPVAVAYGIHPVHFGIVMLANLQIGYFMPPAGMDLFIAAYRFKTGVLTLAKACIPFFLLVGLSVLVITWWPGLSLMLL
jgi:tripartite ATP-independent transporter DctM subunit